MSYPSPGVLRSVIRKETAMEATYRRCCGIDVHKKSVMVCVLPPAGERKGEPRKRKFRTYTRDLKQLRAWLKNCKVTGDRDGVTGQYWRPIWNLLEGHFEKLLLVNPQHIKGLNGYRPIRRMPGGSPICWSR